MKADSDFLTDLNIMDYSLLLGIEKKQAQAQNVRDRYRDRLFRELVDRNAQLDQPDANALSRHQFCSPDLQYVYHVSIIDYLQLWNLNKKAERFAKTKLLKKDAD